VTAASTMSGGSNKLGFGNGFISKTNRFKELPIDRVIDPSINIGPG
jgi:hypothetical protein